MSAGEAGLTLDSKDNNEDAETKSNESKPVTPTESSTLLPDKQEGRAVSRLARKPVRYIPRKSNKNDMVLRT